jgi:hypothetical protein
VIWARGRAALCLGCGILIVGFLAPARAAENFRFDRDTLSFANSTVFDYHEGVAHLRRTGVARERTPRYTRRCFVMCRTVIQFAKFARFEPHGAPLNDEELAHRIHSVTKHPVWRSPFPETERIVFPGYANLRQLSHDRGWVVQKNIGLGWPTYLRLGNSRMVYSHSRSYQQRVHEELNTTLNQGQFFVAFLSDFPTLHINHAVLVYARKPSLPNSSVDRYNCYDPNHPDGPRELIWIPDKKEFNFEKDEEFVGGFTRVYRVYGRWLQ